MLGGTHSGFVLFLNECRGSEIIRPSSASGATVGGRCGVIKGVSAIDDNLIVDFYQELETLLVINRGKDADYELIQFNMRVFILNSARHRNIQ